MRKRSGAIDSSTLESYIKLATYSQNKENIFYSSDYLQIETQLNPNDFRRTTSGQFSESDIPDSPLPKLSSSSSQNRKNSENNVFLKEGSQNEAKKPLNSQSNKWNDSWNFNRNLSINSEENNNENIRIITKQIMVIGSSQTGKKSLIYSLFGENEDETFSNSENIYKEPCFDLIVKTEDVNEKEKNTFKFWIQNLSNEIYDKIIDVYYKSMNMYILIFNCSEKESFEKIKEHFIHLKAVCKNKDPNILLIGMHFSPKHKIEVSYKDASQFAESNKLLGYFVTNMKNLSMNRQIFDIICNCLEVKTKNMSKCL